MSYRDIHVSELCGQITALRQERNGLLEKINRLEYESQQRTHANFAKLREIIDELKDDRDKFHIMTASGLNVGINALVLRVNELREALGKYPETIPNEDDTADFCPCCLVEANPHTGEVSRLLNCILF